MCVSDVITKDREKIKKNCPPLIVGGVGGAVPRSQRSIKNTALFLFFVASER